LRCWIAQVLTEALAIYRDLASSNPAGYADKFNSLNKLLTKPPAAKQ
jgi:hypothetical protein